MLNKPSHPKAPKGITGHPGVACCLDGETEGVTGKWSVWLKPQWRFSATEAQDCTAASFDTVREFLEAAPVQYVGRLTR